MKLINKIKLANLSNNKLINRLFTTNTILKNNLNWKNLNLNPQLIKACELNKLIQPNNIQFNSLKSLLNNEDTLIEAETGSGKTQAYILLSLQRLIDAQNYEVPEQKTPMVLIMVPNKELIWQVTKSFLNFKPVLEEFGISVSLDKTEFKQLNAENKRIIYIGTPSNLFNNLTKRELNELETNLKYCKLCILDEVDFLLSRSYLTHTREMIPYLYKILNNNNGNFALVGATSGPRESEPFNSKLLSKYFKRATRVTSDDLHKLVNKLNVELIEADKSLTTVEINDWKLDTLKDKVKEYILKRIPTITEEEEKSINLIIFANSMNNVNLFKDSLSFLASEELLGYSLHIHPFHKQVPILEREEALKQIILTTKERRINLIISTDLLSRGIDLPLIDFVIQADIPTNVTSYIHRSGRTARFGRSGKMICLVTKLDGFLGELILKGELPSIEANFDDEATANNGNNNKKLDGMFSKRRSLNKKVKRYNEILEESKNE